MEQTKYDVFISYSRKDYVDDYGNVIPANEVSKIMEALTNAGISYWFDQEGIYSEQNFVERIVTNIENAKIFIFLSTVNANKTPWTCKEIASADEFKKHIIPVRIDSSPYNKKVLFRIADLDYIEYYVNPQKGIEDLIKSVKSYLDEFAEEERCKKEEQKKNRLEENCLYKVQSSAPQPQGLTVKGHIDQDSLNQSTRSKKITEEEKNKERQRSMAQRNKRVRIGERVDINALLGENRPRNAGKKNNQPQNQSQGKAKKGKKNQPQVAEVSEEEVAKQVRETLARLTGKNQLFCSGAKHCREECEVVCQGMEELERQVGNQVLKPTGSMMVNELAAMLNVLNFNKQDYEVNVAPQDFPHCLDEVYCSIFAPAEVKPKSHMLVQIYLHLFEEIEKVKALAQESDKNAERRDYIPLQCKLKKGDKVDVQLNIYGETLLMTDKKSVVWQGSFTKCSFDYFVPKDIEVGELSCVAMLTVNGIPVGEMRFITRIVDAPRQLNPEIIAHKYNKVFISYSHQDESKVKFLHEGLAMGGVPHFFDRSYLKPGDIFPLVIQDYINSADLFILCWSENAAQSEYVKKERILALERAYPKVQDGKLLIYPMNIEPRAELPADMKEYYHFGDI